jgi:hypothetical protein
MSAIEALADIGAGGDNCTLWAYVRCACHSPRRPATAGWKGDWKLEGAPYRLLVLGLQSAAVDCCT